MRNFSLVGVLLCAASCAAHGQWVQFHDRSGARLAIGEGADDREKDCGVGDFDRDGWEDVVVVRKAPFKTRGGAEDLLLMNVSGTLTDQTALYAPEFLTVLTDARDVFVTDIDGDLWPDLILANTFGEQPVCYRNQGADGDGNWLGFVDESAERLPNIAIPALQFCAVCAADITGDGAPDLYFSNYVRAPDIALDVLLVNDGSGHFSDASDARLGVLRQSAFGTSVDIRDIDNDGDRDIIKTSSLNPVPPWNEIGVFVLFNDGTGVFESFQSVPTESPYMFAVDDLNNDELLDLYIVNDSQDFVVLNAGVDESLPDPVEFEKSVLQDSPRTTFLGGNLQCRDLDNDGDLDVAVADVDIDIGICETAPGDPRKFALLRNDGDASGTLVDPWGMESNVWNTNVFDFAVLDIDRDGKLDLFLASCIGYSVLMQEHTLHVSSAAISFGEVIAGATEERVLRVCNNGAQPTSITNITTTGQAFSASGATEFVLAPYECRELIVTFAPPAPGDYAATLQIAGDLSREIVLGGTSVTPPAAEVDAASFSVLLGDGAAERRTLSLANLGGSDLEFDVRLRVPGLQPDSVLLMGDPLTQPLLVDILNMLPNDHGDAELGTITADSFEGYETVLLPLANGAVSSEDMDALTGAVRSGKTLIIIGASTDPDFLTGLEAGLLSHTDDRGWKAPESPHFQLVDHNHPLADGLPATHEFSASSASWYRIRPDDPAAWVAASNGDGVPCLLSKKVGNGTLIYFTNWPLGVVWDNPIDRPIFETIIANAIGSARTAWLSVSLRAGTVSMGESVPIDVAFNTFGQPPGHYEAELVITTNDPARPQLAVAISLDVTARDAAAGLRIEYRDAGVVTLSLRGESGNRYQIQRSTDLVRWEAVGEVVAGEEAVLVTHPVGEGDRRAFFRAKRLDPDA